MDEQIDRQMGEWMDRWMNRCVDDDGLMDGQIDELVE